MKKSQFRSMQRTDWTAVRLQSGSSNANLPGYQLREGSGNPLHAIEYADNIEDTLATSHRAVRDVFPDARIMRRHVQMPYLQHTHTPAPEDYHFVDAPDALTTTAITILMLPQDHVHQVSLGFYFKQDVLPTLRERMMGVPFQGIAGNLGYYMTSALISGSSAWAHNTRYPQFPLPNMASYLGFHWQRDANKDAIHSTFQGAHPATVALDRVGNVRILPHIAIEQYIVRIAEREFVVEQVNAPHAIESPVVAFTAGVLTDEVKRFKLVAETSAGADRTWQTYAPMIPLTDAAKRIHVFLANEGNGAFPCEKVVTVWDGFAPLPSFGTVLSFTRAYFEQLFGSVQIFRERHLNSVVDVVPIGDFDPWVRIMGGFVPIVADGEHLLTGATVHEIMAQGNLHGNAHSPISQLGRETENFHPFVREPAGVLFQTSQTIGWVLFDGRHELSIGASLIDVAVLMRKLEASDVFQSESIQQAIIIDGGSAMKAYHIQSDQTAVQLDLLNRVAAGARNGPSRDPDGRNLYALLMLALPL